MCLIAGTQSKTLAVLSKDLEGEEIVRQFSVLKHHRREDIYDLSGNHDRSGLQS